MGEKRGGGEGEEQSKTRKHTQEREKYVLLARMRVVLV